MHTDFADWYQSTYIDINPEILELRWQGVREVSNTLDPAGIPTLIKLAFGRGDDEESKSKFIGVFKEIDPGFLLKNNDHEIVVLASSVLAYHMSADYEDAGLIATSILTAYFFGERKTEAKFDLLGIAKNTIIKESQIARARPIYKEIPFPNITKKNIIEKIEEITQQPSWEKIDEVLKFMTEQSLLRTKQTRDAIQDHIRPVWDYITVQDEELEMAWWLVNQWCQLAERPFNEVPIEMRSLLFGKEIADKIHVNIEPPSLMGMLDTAGVGNNKLTVSEAVNACGIENLSKFQNLSDACSTLTPINLAISRAIETECGDSWIPAWQNICGISAIKKYQAIDIAMQVYRECVVLMNLAESVE